MKELDTVILLRDLTQYGLVRGHVGTVVNLHANGAAFEVEFITPSGRTIAVVTLELGDVREPVGDEVLHARRATSVRRP